MCDFAISSRTSMTQAYLRFLNAAQAIPGWPSESPKLKRHPDTFDAAMPFNGEACFSMVTPVETPERVVEVSK